MRRSKRKSKVGLLLTSVIVVAAGLACIAALISYSVLTGKGVDSNPVTKTVNREATKKAVETVIQKETGTDVTISEVKEQMSEEDGQELEEIIDKYADEGIVSEALEVYQSNNGDIQATASEMKDKVSDEDKARLYELYQKYGDKIPEAYDLTN